jgi:hypothetical protein
VKATHDPHARSLDDARRFAGDPWAAALLDRLREEGLRDYVFVPLEPRDPMAHRWLGISSDGRLGSPARDELECFAPLIRAIDMQHRVVAGFSGASAHGMPVCPGASSPC